MIINDTVQLNIDTIKRNEARARITTLKDRNGIKKVINSNFLLYPNELALLTNLLRFNTNPLSNIQKKSLGVILKRYRKSIRDSKQCL